MTIEIEQVDENCDRSNVVVATIEHPVHSECDDDTATVILESSQTNLVTGDGNRDGVMTADLQTICDVSGMVALEQLDDGTFFINVRPLVSASAQMEGTLVSSMPSNADIYRAIPFDGTGGLHGATIVVNGTTSNIISSADLASLLRSASLTHQDQCYSNQIVVKYCPDVTTGQSTSTS